MASVSTINVGGRHTVPRLRLSRVNGLLFFDADPILFEHVLNFLRRPFPPIFWTRTNGFDLALYVRLLNEAEYFQLDALADWIREKK
ncbi:hypothetical protein B0A48_18540 [Cryoendolithus antarcticus]|uniref:Potassium channel tetramerisation-type BTB domain-containing protein n=1 Tax=Cryoendolithus antarcticus TaxID=1507870 RepID=A0A1V8S8V7_9PEZI|nr:hypothetical protein B0A48_18540 [Cryoendolithus antarcticus]